MSAAVALLLLTVVMAALLWGARSGAIAFRAGGLAIARPAREFSVSIVIPARNEAQNLPRLLRSIFRQSALPHEVIVVDDGSTDETVAIARAAGAILLSAPAMEGEGWTGKAWACQSGARVARGEFLFFLDADTWLEDDGLGKALAEARKLGGATSFLPYHAVERPYENVSAFFNLIMALVGRLEHRLFGQSLLIRRADFWAVGGYESVRGEVLENFCLSPRLKAAGLATHARFGRGVIHMRMYPSGVSELWQGWSKAFARGANATSGAVMGGVVLWFSGALIAVFLAVTSPLFGLAAYGLFALELRAALKPTGSFARWVPAIYPVWIVAFFAIFTHAALRRWVFRQAVWKGRSVHA